MLNKSLMMVSKHTSIQNIPLYPCYYNWDSSRRVQLAENPPEDLIEKGFGVLYVVWGTTVAIGHPYQIKERQICLLTFKVLNYPDPYPIGVFDIPLFYSSQQKTLHPYNEAGRKGLYSLIERSFPRTQFTGSLKITPEILPIDGIEV